MVHGLHHQAIVMEMQVQGSRRFLRVEARHGGIMSLARVQEVTITTTSMQRETTSISNTKSLSKTKL